MPIIRRPPLALSTAAVLCALAALPGPTQASTIYDWSSGYFSDAAGLPNPLAAGDLLSVLPGGSKYLNVNFSNLGTVRQSDNLYLFGYSATQSSGTWELLADIGLGNGGYSNTFANSGTLRKSGGSGVSVINGIGFTNSGLIDVQTGSIDFASGLTTFNVGTQFIGAGRAVVSNHASFNGAFSASNLELRSGTFSGGAAEITGSVDWTGGSLAGSWTVASGQTLNIQSGSSKFMAAALTNAGQIRAKDELYLFGYSTLTNTGLYDLQGDVGLSNGGYSNAFINSGTFRKSAGAGNSVIGNGTSFTNSGLIAVQVGTLTFAGGDANFLAGTQFTGAGEVQITNNAAFAGAIATTGRLSLVNGSFSGNAVVLNGDAAWSGGTLTGNWSLAAGRTLAIQAGNTKYMAAAMTNAGTLAAADDLYLFGYNTLTNEGLYQLQGDVGIYNGGYSNNFINNGSLRKSAGNGVSSIGAGTAFDNRGVIDVLSGTIDFAGGDATFRDGSRFAGSGQVRVSNSARFIGTQRTAGNLTLSGGNFFGGDGNPDSVALLDGDVRWTGGQLSGNWSVAAGRTLDIAAGSVKTMGAALFNNGRIRATDELFMFGYNTLTNNELYEMQGDVGISNGGYNNQFINNGSFRKSAGNGVSTVGSGTGFQNNGLVEAQTGILAFTGGDASFNNGSRFKGPGQIVINNGAQFHGSFTTDGPLTLTSGNFTGYAARIDGDVNWSGGALQGEWTLAAGRTMKLLAGSQKTLQTSLTNDGRLHLSDNVYLFGYTTLSNNGVIELAGDFGLLNGGYSNVLLNNGLLVKSSGSGSSSLADNALANQGVIDVQTGTLVLPGNFTNEGKLTGLATFAAAGTLTNAGHVDPGAAAGRLTINANFAQIAAGVLDIDLGTLGHSDQLLVTGTASLSGTLALHCLAACSFAIGDRLLILDSNGLLNGSFSGDPTLSGFATGKFALDYDRPNGDVWLRVTDTVTAVPEPASYALLLGGLVALLAKTRRRTAPPRQQT